MLQLDLQSRQPIYEQLILRLTELISLGVLEADTQLPSVRTLARDLGVNPNTVQNHLFGIGQREFCCTGRRSTRDPQQTEC